MKLHAKSWSQPSRGRIAQIKQLFATKFGEIDEKVGNVTQQDPVLFENCEFW